MSPWASSGAVQGVRKVGEEAGDLARDGAMGTLDAAYDIGSKAGGMAKKAATNTAAVPHDIIKSRQHRRAREVATERLGGDPSFGVSARPAVAAPAHADACHKRDEATDLVAISDAAPRGELMPCGEIRVCGWPIEIVRISGPE